MYPDNVMHGEQLVEMLLRLKSGKPQARISPSRGLLKAINSRTAEHLDINLTKSELREYDLVFSSV